MTRDNHCTTTSDINRSVFLFLTGNQKSRIQLIIKELKKILKIFQQSHVTNVDNFSILSTL